MARGIKGPRASARRRLSRSLNKLKPAFADDEELIDCLLEWVSTRIDVDEALRATLLDMLHDDIIPPRHLLLRLARRDPASRCAIYELIRGI